MAQTEYTPASPERVQKWMGQGPRPKPRPKPKGR